MSTYKATYKTFENYSFILYRFFSLACYLFSCMSVCFNDTAFRCHPTNISNPPNFSQYWHWSCSPVYMITSRKFRLFPLLHPKCFTTPSLPLLLQWISSNFHFSPYKHISAELFNKRHPLLGLIRSFLFSFIIFAWLCKVLLLLVKLDEDGSCAMLCRHLLPHDHLSIEA